MWNPENKDVSVIGEDLVVNGNINCKCDLMIEGRVEGNVSCTSLLVSRCGRIIGDISSESVLLEGSVQGMINSRSVELKEGCLLLGDIASQTLAVDHGANFTGSVKSTRPADKPELTEAAE
jgi:cytoskeletal protein CcmA (bactofilin family)